MGGVSLEGSSHSTTMGTSQLPLLVLSLDVCAPLMAEKAAEACSGCLNLTMPHPLLALAVGTDDQRTHSAVIWVLGDIIGGNGMAIGRAHHLTSA